MRYASVVALVIGSVGALAAPRVADACGGCFAPTETQQVVTDHRMVMSVHARESILWDQIRYTGRPEDFSWVLPVWGDVRVELASGEFFDLLDQNTAVRVRGPFVSTTCGVPSGGGGCGAANAAPRAAAGGGNEETVQVLREEVVGPYQTVTLRSSDPMSLTTWLRTNRYVVPPSIEPIINFYVERRMDFVALRLRPGQGVQSMQPVRVRYATANMVLPLRMVAAGVGDKVGILLWVFGSGRFEAANFANATVEQSELVWNWDTNRSNYPDVFNATIARTANGRAWLTEYAEPANELGGVMGQRSLEDWNLATNNGDPSVWVSRLRADLAAAHLDADLQLQASSAGTGVDARISNVLQATRSTGTAPGSRCGSVVGIASPLDVVRRPAQTLAGIAASLVALAYARRRARRRSEAAQRGSE